MHVSSFTELNGQTQTMMAMYTVPPVTDTTISTVDTPTLTTSTIPTMPSSKVYDGAPNITVTSEKQKKCFALFPQLIVSVMSHRHRLLWSQ